MGAINPDVAELIRAISIIAVFIVIYKAGRAGRHGRIGRMLPYILLVFIFSLLHSYFDPSVIKPNPNEAVRHWKFWMDASTYVIGCIIGIVAYFVIVKLGGAKLFLSKRSGGQKTHT